MSETYQLAETPKLLEVRQSAEVGELFAAFVKAQAHIGPAITNRENKFNNSRYADLAAVNEAFRSAFADNGLGVIQFPFTRTGVVTRSYREQVEVDTGRRTVRQNRPVYLADNTPMLETVPVIYVVVRTRIVHESGQWFEHDLEIPVVMGSNPAQDVGQVITYGQRYALRAIAGVATEDDDGQGLEGTGTGDAPAKLPTYNHVPPSAHAANNKPQGPSVPQGSAGRINALIDRLAQAENLTTLRALYESAFREFETLKAGEADFAKLEEVKDSIKAGLTEAAEKPATQATKTAVRINF